MKDKEYVYWTYSDYRILQIMPGDGYLVVYAMEKDGKTYLESRPCEMLAVVDVTTVDYRRHKSAKLSDYEEIEKNESSDVAALCLSGGWWEVCNQDSNYAGMCRVGEDISEVTGYLTRDYLKKLEDSKQKSKKKKT